MPKTKEVPSGLAFLGNPETAVEVWPVLKTYGFQGMIMYPTAINSDLAALKIPFLGYYVTDYEELDYNAWSEKFQYGVSAIVIDIEDADSELCARVKAWFESQGNSSACISNLASCIKMLPIIAVRDYETCDSLFKSMEEQQYNILTMADVYKNDTVSESRVTEHGCPDIMDTQIYPIWTNNSFDVKYVSPLNVLNLCPSAAASVFFDCTTAPKHKHAFPCGASNVQDYLTTTSYQVPAFLAAMKERPSIQFPRSGQAD